LPNSFQSTWTGTADAQFDNLARQSPRYLASRSGLPQFVQKFALDRIGAVQSEHISWAAGANAL
jgi:hypothetical protein